MTGLWQLDLGAHEPQVLVAAEGIGVEMGHPTPSQVQQAFLLPDSAAFWCSPGLRAPPGEGDGAAWRVAPTILHTCPLRV